MKKKFLIFICLIIFIISIAGVSATDDVNQANGNISSISQNDNEILEVADGGTFSDLQSKINGADEGSIINLENDYKFNSQSDTNVIKINKNIKINGNGYTIDGNHAAMFLSIGKYDVTLRNINFVNGDSSSGSGGNIVSGTVVTLGDLIVDNCNFINNKGGYGGALEAYGKLDLTNSNFTNNYGVFGGAVFLNGDNSRILNCNFVDNSVMLEAGAVYASGENSIISDCLFINNKANASSGALSWAKNNGTLNKCTFVNNSAFGSVESISHTGGAVVWKGDAAYGLISNCRFINNTATDGGAILLQDDIYGTWGYQMLYLTIENSTFMYNNASSGGAIYSNRLLEIIDSEFSNNTALELGGAIFTSNGIRKNDVSAFFPLFISGHTQFKGNDALIGGAINIENNPNYNMLGYLDISDDVVFEENFAQYFGGAIFLESTLAYIDSATFNYNAALGGGAIGSVWESFVSINNSMFYNNFYIYNNYGGSISAQNDLEVLNSIFYSIFDQEFIYYSNYIDDGDIMGNLTLDNNIMIGKNHYDIWYNASTPMLFKTYLFFENKTISSNENVNLGELQDECGNSIRIPAFTVKLTNVNNPSIKDTATLTYNDETGGYNYDCNLDSGVYQVTGFLQSNIASNYDVIEGYLTISDYNITVMNVVKNYKGSEKLEITLTEKNNPLANAEIKVNISGKISTATTDSKGKAYVPLNLDAGTYEAIVSYKEVSATVNITINQLTTKNVLKLDKNIVTATVSPSSATGNVIFNVNGKNYTVKVGNGKATYNLENLGEGTYEVYSIYEGDTNHKTSTSTTIKVTIAEHNIKISAPDVTKSYGGSEELEITLTNQDSEAVANVELKIILAGETYTKTTDNNGKAYLGIDLNSGTYNATIVFEGNSEYGKATSISKITINKITTKTNITSTKKSPESYILTASVSPIEATGNVIFNVNGEDYIAKISNGIATYTLSDLDLGTYKAKATYNGQTNYKSSSSSIISFDVVDVEYKVSAPDLTKYYKGSERFVVTVKDKNDNAVVGGNVTINLNGQTYTKTTDSNGQASMAINLNSGIYEVTSVYAGIEVKSTITIKSTVSGENITKIFRNGTQYYATFIDTSGKTLANNTAVEFNINGVFYTRYTNEKGVARMNINLNPGEYIITAKNPDSGEMYTNIITVLPTIVENHDLTKYYRNASQYSLRLLDDKGNPVGAGVDIKLNINGVFYTRTSNASGYVNMNINLNPGEYTITAEYNGLMASNTIKVLSVIESKNLVMKYKDGSRFEAKILDGQGKPYFNQTVTFNINGVFYDKVTDENGIAGLKINLMAGEYIITTSYNGLNAANKITISS